MKSLRIFLSFVLLSGFLCSNAQIDSLNKRYQVAIFTPLYLDSAFDTTGVYKYDKSFPKFFNPGLEFYEGVQLALDTLEKEKANLDIYIYDLKSASKPLTQILNSNEFSNLNLIIGNVNNSEMMLLAKSAAIKHIPFINVNFPNDGGVRNNPYFVILNSTLRTHCEGIYKYIQRQYPLSDILVFRKKGAQEDKLQEYMNEYGKATASVPLKLRFINLEKNFDSTKLETYLVKDHQTVCIAGSLDLTFGSNLIQNLSALSDDYPLTLIGMPNWDLLSDLNKPGIKNLEVIYSTPFNIANTTTTALSIQDYFKNKFYSRPSDMVFRGYEIMYHFGKLLLQYGPTLNSSIGEKKFTVFTDFNIQPVFSKKPELTLDYFENKKLYFIRKLNGVIAGIN